jgi:hypothetical protein
MSRLGTITLQSQDGSDIFVKEDVFLDGEIDAGELPCHVQGADPGFESGQAWLTGKVPAPIPIIVEGDSTMITGWFKSDGLYPPFYLRIYIEYEEVEEMVTEKENEEKDDRGINTELCT